MRNVTCPRCRSPQCEAYGHELLCPKCGFNETPRERFFRFGKRPRLTDVFDLDLVDDARVVRMGEFSTELIDELCKTGRTSRLIDFLSPEKVETENEYVHERNDEE